MNKILKSKNPIILLLVVLLSGVSLSNTAHADDAIAFGSLSANGAEGVTTTTELTLEFDIDPAGLAIEDITVIGATKGTLTGGGIENPGVYILTINSITVADGANINVAVAKTGFNFTPTNRDVAVAVAEEAPPAGDTEAPVITANDETVAIADLAAWVESASALDVTDGELTASLIRTYFQEDGTTELADLAAAKAYIGDATTNTIFVIKYNVDDEANNPADEVTITITVTEEAPPAGDTEAPFIVSIGLADSSADWYGIGDTDDLKIYFSENIEVDSIPSITFQGNDDFNLILTYVSHSGAEMIVSYTLEEDVTPERIFLASYSVTEFVGGISDEAGNPVDFSDLVISSEVFLNNTEDEFFRSVEEISDSWDVIRPVITSGSTATATENSVITGYTLTATDADENLIGASFSIDGGDDADLFEIDNTAGILSFIIAPDFDTAGDADGNNVYVVTLQAIDVAGNTDTKTVSVTLTNDAGDDAPPAPPAPSAPPAPAAASFTPSTPQTALVLSTNATSVGWGLQVKLTVTGGSGTGALTYSSTGTTLCAVDSSGNLTPVSVGTCTVTANKAGDGTYGSAQSNSITITATNAIQPIVAATSVVSMVVGKPVGGVATVRFTVPSTNAGSRVSVVLGTKNSTGKIIYRTLGSATVTSTGVVTYKTRVKLPVGAVLQLRAPGSLILSRVIR